MTDSQHGPTPDTGQPGSTPKVEQKGFIARHWFLSGFVAFVILVGSVAGTYVYAMQFGTPELKAAVNDPARSAVKLADTMAPIGTASAQDKKPAPAPASSGTKLDQEVEGLLKEGRPNVVAIPQDQMRPPKFRGQESLFSMEEIRKNIDWLKDRSAVLTSAFTRVVDGLVWVVKNQYKEAADLKLVQELVAFFDDSKKKLVDAVSERFGEEAAFALLGDKDNVLKQMQKKDVELEGKIAKVEGELAEAKETLGGLFVGVPSIDAVVQIDYHNRRVVDVYDAQTGQSLIDAVYFNEHQMKKGSHWAISKLAFVSWVQRPGESGMHHVLWQFNTGYRPGIACPHAPLNKCVRVYASDPASGYYDAKGMARELVRQGLTKAESSSLMDQRKKNVKE